MGELVTWAYELAREKLAVALPRRWQHVQGVAMEAVRISDVFEPHGELLIAAAVLHDIGYAPDLATTGFHSLDGARYLTASGAPERLVNLVANHSCARLEAQLRGLAAELAAYPDECTPVRDALWYCDMTMTPDGEPCSFDTRAEEIHTRYGPEHVVSQFMAQARDEIRAAVQRTKETLVPTGLDTWDH
ncbi:HDIG domain-containing metalloprotein [Longimycelium tulufanense]|uniref:HDIG domain-containing metalloprotein n=1 Tax=Longimycelium tulufanense TaxID=907463 RepID=UPI001E3B4E6B|nr:HDIG domain-containing metalloprotein [Longimycelium tulufanense]